ncbi:hypothetical protein HJG60_009566 [Phyllostomus discolor]|uniref:Uncharacterized protein n=1 Tax=Phyllostomus discolor TaxID=89673 RepID=A0A833YFG1_9CHIR|nr:hypothetical protein HJG60_009566 [Phyllostomus discolor]
MQRSTVFCGASFLNFRFVSTWGLLSSRPSACSNMLSLASLLLHVPYWTFCTLDLRRYNYSPPIQSFSILSGIPPLSSIMDYHIPSIMKSYQFGLQMIILFKDFIYLFILERGQGREKEERYINMWLPLLRPLLGTWPAAQVCALTRSRKDGLLVHRLALNPLYHTSQGSK